MRNDKMEKQKQFGWKLLWVIIVVLAFFTFWYLYEKNNGAQNPALLPHEQVKMIPGDTLKSLAKKVEQQAIQISSGSVPNYDADYKLIVRGAENLSLKAVELDGFFKNLEGKIGKMVPASLKIVTLGNSAKITYTTDKNVQVFRQVSFDKLESLSPVVLEEVLEYGNFAKTDVLGVGDMLPAELKFEAVLNNEYKTVDLGASSNKWKLLVFYPADFTFVCPTEIKELMDNYELFKSKNTEVYGISSDLNSIHLAWTKNYYGSLPYALISDNQAMLSRMFNFWDAENSVALRGTMIVSPDGKIVYTSAVDNSVGRNTDEMLRIISALQTPGLKPVNWKEGDPTL